MDTLVYRYTPHWSRVSSHFSYFKIVNPVQIEITMTLQAPDRQATQISFSALDILNLPAHQVGDAYYRYVCPRLSSRIIAHHRRALPRIFCSFANIEARLIHYKARKKYRIYQKLMRHRYRYLNCNSIIVSSSLHVLVSTSLIRHRPLPGTARVTFL